MTSLGASSFIIPAWPAADTVRARSTTRLGGHSPPPYDGFNLGIRVGDDRGAVERNRRDLAVALALPGAPVWLRQVHGARVVSAGAAHPQGPADACVATRPGQVCAVLTADCLPVLLCDRRGSRVACAHAGWRGLAAGVLEATVAAMDCGGGSLIAWLGPGIGPRAFEVGSEVRQAFVRVHGDDAEAFEAGRDGRWQADLFTLARRRLARAGVTDVFGGGECTFSDPYRFFSHRRDGVCGRMASLVWLEA